MELFYRFFSARKHGFADAGVRDNQADRTAFVSLPGGVGTLDEIFEISTLIQLQRLGSAYPVPLLVLNYDGFFTGLLQFLKSCQEWGTVSAGELDALWKVCNTNLEALEYLADFYGISESDRLYRKTLQDSSNRPSKWLKWDCWIKIVNRFVFSCPSNMVMCRVSLCSKIQCPFETSMCGWVSEWVSEFIGGVGIHNCVTKLYCRHSMIWCIWSTRPY